MFIYRTYFKLTAPVIDFHEASAYLTADDMTKYLNQDSRRPSSLQGAVSSINWVLRDTQSGYIELQSNRELDDKELEWISDWVSGQNSDGLGEGFEQQSFACYSDGGYEGFGGEYDEYYEDDYVMASFDWQTNEYKFELISST